MLVEIRLNKSLTIYAMFSGGTDYPIPNLDSSHNNNDQTRKSVVAARYHGRRAKKCKKLSDQGWSQVLGANSLTKH
ncbi:hypothetical protein L873DRAFT_1824251 [Choiromyces venosus 120613-1]|uniref:Uncharacterized protein n=1 Tax=Choiromyces venosus 120613-1 TaxID=1336337 RepID=A0A3N4IWF7_9PEZI|nr:hypothetical protein L873DRAFT_1824251 [Choiromyces venosus 120613-1]